MSDKIGFIGLGVMGKPMAENLVKGGYSVFVYDIRGEAVETLVNQGAKGGKSPAEICENSNIVITMLPTSAEVKQVCLGQDGAISKLKKNSILIDMSTIEPMVSQEIQKIASSRKIETLDAPVSGGEAGAIAGSLTIMVGGDEKVFERCKTLFEAMGSNIYYCGKNGAGQTVKITNNLVAAICMQATCEGFVLGAKAGVSPKVLLDVLSKSSAQNWSITTYMPNKAFKGNFEAGFMVDLMYKDLGLAQDLASTYKVPTFLGAECRQIFELARAMGKGKRDFSAILTVLEEAVGTEIRI